MVGWRELLKSHRIGGILDWCVETTTVCRGYRLIYPLKQEWSAVHIKLSEGDMKKDRRKQQFFGKNFGSNKFNYLTAESIKQGQVQH